MLKKTPIRNKVECFETKTSFVKKINVNVCIDFINV